MDDCGQYDHLIERRDAVLSSARVSPAARARILGRHHHRPAAKTHIITVNIKAETRTVETRDGSRPPPSTVPRARKPIPVAARPTPPASGTGVPSRRHILDAVAETFKVTVSALVGPSHDKRSAYARFAAIRLMRDKCKMSYPQIGRALSGRDHTTIMGALRRAEYLLEANAEWAERYHAAELLLSPAQ